MGATEKETPENAASKSFFDVLFVGLFCFKRSERVAVMPDGREPDDEDVQAHEPFLVVDPKHVNADGTKGWENNDPELTEKGVYTFSKCTIHVTKATTKGDLVPTQHDEKVPKAVTIDSTFEYGDDWGAGIIAAIELGHGTLESLRRPDRRSIEEGVGTLSRLRVPHDGDVIVTVAVTGEPQPRVLALNPGSDLAIVNGILEADSSKTGSPFKLFGKIAKSGKFTPGGSRQTPDVDVIGANYQVFKIGLPFIVDGIGCCPPP